MTVDSTVKKSGIEGTIAQAPVVDEAGSDPVAVTVVIVLRVSDGEEPAPGPSLALGLRIIMHTDRGN